MEVGDDDMMKDWNHDLMIIRRSLRTNESQRQEVEDHVWFEDRWMVASLCDE
jgi:hypothetical protein